MGKGSSTKKSGLSKNRYTKSDTNEADVMKKSSFRVDEVAKELGCSEKTVRRLIKDDAIDAFKLGHTWRIKSEAVDRFTAKKNGQYKPIWPCLAHHVPNFRLFSRHFSVESSHNDK